MKYALTSGLIGAALLSSSPAVALESEAVLSVDDWERTVLWSKTLSVASPCGEDSWNSRTPDRRDLFTCKTGNWLFSVRTAFVDHTPVMGRPGASTFDGQFEWMKNHSETADFTLTETSGRRSFLARQLGENAVSYAKVIELDPDLLLTMTVQYRDKENPEALVVTERHHHAALFFLASLELIEG